MKPFKFLAPTGLPEALKLLDDLGAQARLQCGGQSLNLELKERLAKPAFLVSLRNISELRGWRMTADGELEIGAATTYAALMKAEFSGWHREISLIVGNLADRSVRTMGTIGGAAAQADPRFDVPVLLVAADARMTIAASGAERIVPARDFFPATGGTCLKPSEILVRVTFPAASAYDALTFEKYRFRVFDAAIVSVAIAVKASVSGRIDMVRITVGAVEKAPRVAENSVAGLVGQTLSALTAPELAEVVADEILSAERADTHHRRYQRELIKAMVGRAAARVQS